MKLGKRFTAEAQRAQRKGLIALNGIRKVVKAGAFSFCVSKVALGNEEQKLP